MDKDNFFYNILENSAIAASGSKSESLLWEYQLDKFLLLWKMEMGKTGDDRNWMHIQEVQNGRKYIKISKSDNLLHCTSYQLC